MIKVAINGFGRIGSLAFRAAILSDDIEVVAISAPNHPASHVAYCVKYDTVHGRFPGVVTSNDEDSTITVNGKVVKILSDKSYRDASLLPWGELGVDYVLECTGVYLTKEKAQAHIDAGAKLSRSRVMPICRQSLWVVTSAWLTTLLERISRHCSADSPSPSRA